MKTLKILAGIVAFPFLMLSGIVLALIGLSMLDYRKECINWLMG